MQRSFRRRLKFSFFFKKEVVIICQVRRFVYKSSFFKISYMICFLQKRELVFMITDFIPREFLVIAIIAFVLFLVVYIAQAIFLSKFHKLVYGKGKILGWIHVCNTYILGKLVVNKFVGWIMVLAIFLTGTFTITVNDTKSVYSILPDSIRSVYINVYSIVVFGFFIFAIVKYVKLKKAKKNEQAQNSNPSSGMGVSSGNDVSLGNNVTSQGAGMTQGIQLSSTPSVNVNTIGMEPSNVSVSPLVGGNPQNMNVTSQQEVVSPSVTTVSPVKEPSHVPGSPVTGVNSQNTNVSSTSVEPSSMDMSKPVIDVFQFVNPETSSSTNNPATSSEESVESLQIDDTIK